MAAVVSRFRLERPPGRSADLLAFHRVVDGLADAVEAVVPVSFGSVMLDEEAIFEDLLAPNEDWFGELVDGVRGRVQLIVQGRYDQDGCSGGGGRGPRDRPAARADPGPSRGRRAAASGYGSASSSERPSSIVVRSTAVPCSRTSCPSPPPTWCAPSPGSSGSSTWPCSWTPPSARSSRTRLEVLAEEVHGRIRLRLLGPTAPYDFAGEA